MLFLGACGSEDGERQPKDGKVAILAFSAEPASVEAGGEVELSWRSRNAAYLNLMANGAPLDLPEGSLEEGKRKVTVWERTRFELVAVGADGSEAKEELTVDIVHDGPAILSFTADEEVIDYGASTILRWTSKEVQRVTIRSADGETLLDDSDRVDGTLQVSPARTTTYELLGEGHPSTEPARATVEVEVAPVILRFASTASGPIPEGAEVTLEWEVGGAEEIEISTPEGFRHAVEVEEKDQGEVVAPMGASGVFRIVAKSGSREVEQSLTLEHLGLPTIASFVADPPVVTRPDVGPASVFLVWSGVEGADSLTLRGDTTGSIDISQHNLEGDAVRVFIQEPTVFTLTAVNEAGESQAHASVRLVPAPAIDSFAAVPSHVGAGESLELRWQVRDAVAVEVRSEEGETLSLPDPTALSGKVDTQVAADTTFVLRAYNEAEDWVEETVQVTVGAPLNLAFTVEPTHVAQNQPATLSWENLGGTRMEIRDGDGEVVCATQIPEEVASSSCSYVSAKVGEIVLTLHVENGISQSDTAQTLLLVTNGPIIQRFAVAPPELTAGDEFTVEWEVGNDAAGRKPTLRLSDGVDTYPMDDVDPNVGSKSFKMMQEGEVELVLEASTPEGSSSLSRTILVHPAPTMELHASSPHYDGSAPITLSWTSKGTEQGLALYEVDRTGALIEPPVYDVPEEERAQGSKQVTPPLSHPAVYRLVGVNALGVEGSVETEIEVGSPVIDQFTATSLEVVDGDEVELSWTTRLTEKVHVVATDEQFRMEVSDTAPAFHDISGIGTAHRFDRQQGKFFVPVDLSSENFAFPFGGKVYDKLRVAERGFLSFGNTLDRDQRGNINIPTPDDFLLELQDIHLAPAWGGVDLSDPSSSLHVATVLPPTGPRQFVAQWSHAKFDWGIGTIETNENLDLNFQVVLYENGDFDFRYGDMLPALDPIANGSRVTIGFQTEGQTDVKEVFFGGNTNSGNMGTPYPSGLSNHGWSFRRPVVPSTGSVRYVPKATEEVTLIAAGKGVVRSAVKIVVHPRATLAAKAPTGEIQANDSFEISWVTTDATTVQVVDENDQVRCTADPDQVKSGSCELTETTPGFHTYTVRALGALDHVVEDRVVVQVRKELRLLSFQTDADYVGWRDPVVLSWQTVGAESFTLTANGNPLQVLPGNWAQGQLVVHPEEETLYRLEIGVDDGRTRVEERRVAVRTLEWDGATADKDSVRPGDPVNFSWDPPVSRIPGQTPVLYVNMPLEEVDASPGSPHAFRDISQFGIHLPMQQCPGASTTTHSEGCNVFEFPDGFSFPFGSERQTKMRVFVKGVASFEEEAPGRNVHGTYGPFPHEEGELGAYAHLAPFWENLFFDNNQPREGRVYYLLDGDPGDRHLIVQWTDVRFNNTGGAAPTTLTFQVVLWENGAFEYRYGDMADTRCAPSQLDRVQGSQAVIGYQFPGGHSWFNLHDGREMGPVPGGLSGRTFRAEAFDPANPTVRPIESHTYRMCAQLTTFVECDEMPVQASWGISEFTVSEESVVFGAPVTLSWKTFQVDAIELFANGEALDVSQVDPEQGQLAHTPTGNTVYELVVHSLWRSERSRVFVEVDTIEGVEITLDRDFVFLGEPINVSWKVDARVSEPASISSTFEQMREVGATFVDLNGNVTPETCLSSTEAFIEEIEFPDGFRFPFDGELHDSVRVSTTGYLSFDSSETEASKTPIRIPQPLMPEKHLAVFWDNLRRASAQSPAVFTHLVRDPVQGDHFIVQFSRFAFTTAANQDNVNFQVVLYEDGRFDYRFAEMTSTNATRERYARGSRASIGYQTLSGRAGQQISFGVEHEEGLEHRSWRFDPFPSGNDAQAAFYPTETGSGRVCAKIRGFERCSEELSFTVFRPGDIVITELMLDPDGGSQWFEIRNRSTHEVDLQGMRIVGPGGSHTIGQSVRIPRGGSAILAGGTDVGFAPDYVYDSSFYVHPGNAWLRIEYGNEVYAQVEWNSQEWPIAKGVSLELNQDLLLEADPTDLGPEDFCAPTSSYDGGKNLGTPGAPAAPCVDREYSIDFNAPVQPIDISGVAVPVFPNAETLHNAYDNSETGYQLSFDFPYWGESFRNVWVHSNGFVSFTQLRATFTSNSRIPATAVAAYGGMVAPFWDALHPGERYHEGVVEQAELTVDGKKVFVVRWRMVPNTARNDLARAFVDFQVQLWEDGTFDLVYNEVGGNRSDHLGSGATIGFQKKTPNSSSRVGYDFSYNQVTPILAPGRVVRMTPMP